VQAGGGLSCVVVSINGLSDPVKRRSLCKRLLICPAANAGGCGGAPVTQSTSDEQVRGWVQDKAGPGRRWQGHAFWAHGADRSKGVAVLLDGKVVQGEPTISHQGGEGRLLNVAFQGSQEPSGKCLGCAVGSPNRQAFFEGPFTAACAAMLLMAGDFNCVTHVQDLQVPATQQPAQNSRLQGGPALLFFHLRDQHCCITMQGTALGSTRRVQHPAQREFTQTTHTNPPPPRTAHCHQGPHHKVVG
jgi:hypothetical protein